MLEPDSSPPPCFFCRSNKSKTSYIPETLFQGKRFTYRECLDCGLHFIHPKLSELDLKALYSQAYHQSFYSEEKRDFTRSLELLSRKANGKKLLDFGCGSGTFLKAAQDQGFSTAGVEFDPNQVDHLKQVFPELRFQSAQEFFNGTEKYDVIRLGDVLEHLTNPSEFVETLKTRLEPQGLLLVEGPLETNRSVALYFRRVFFWIKRRLQPQGLATHAPYHTFFANAQNQIRFFEKRGLETLQVQISEEAWPYVGTLSEVKSFSSAIKYSIAKLSIFLSHVFPGWGNRVVYLGKFSRAAT